MKKHYDFSKARRNPYAKRLKKPLTIRVDETTLEYFKDLGERVGMPYQTLINMYLRDCAESRKELRLQWTTADDAA
jgi:predicted DNA binding CopG/RHH family protein